MLKKYPRYVSVAAPAVTILVVVLVWQAAAFGLQIPERLLPAPSAIWAALTENFSSVIAADMLISIQNILLGYCIAIPIGFGIAMICSQFKVVTRAATPLLIILMVTPMATLVPVFKLFWGAGDFLKVLVIVLQTAPVVALNSLTGFSNPPSGNVDVLRSMGCGRWKIFFKAAVPNAMPQVFTGLKLGCILGTIASMVADMSIGQGGLGYRISVYASFAATSSAFATILIAAVLGVVLFQIVSLIERLSTAWNR